MLAQPAAVDVDDLGVLIRREAVVHGLIVDLEVADAVRLGVPVRCAQLAPFGRWRVVQVMDPVHGVLNLLGADAGRRQHDQRLAAKLAAESQELVRPKAVVVRVAAPERVGGVSARDVRADAVLPLIGGSEGSARPSDEGRSEISQGLQQVRAQHAVAPDIGAHHREVVDQQRSSCLPPPTLRTLVCP